VSETLQRTDQTIFPNIQALLTIMCTLPVTSCESERAFSQLKLVKNYLRNTMVEERLNGLTLMKVHHALTEALSIPKIIDKFARLHPRRMAQENLFEDK